MRALKWYLKKTELPRKLNNVKHLFLTTNSPYRPASRVTIANWVVLAITRTRTAGGEVGRPRAHDARGYAASTAFRRGVSMADVVDTIQWKSDNVFITTYLKDQLPDTPASRFGEAVLTQLKQ